MNGSAFPDALLVAVDFSPCSLRALDTALRWRRSTTEVTVLHVVDTHLARRLERTGVATYAEAIAKMRTRADEELAWLRADRGEGAFETMVVEGVPFLEIVKIAADLESELVIMGSHGATADLDHLLFGSTAEKVLRGARQPVLCVP